MSGKVFFGTEHNEWLSGRSLLLSRQEEPNVFGGAGVAVMAYDRTAKTYKYHQMKSNGAEEDLFGTFKDGTWTWTSNETAQTKQAPKTRLIMKELNDSSYSLSLETASDGQEWFVVMEGIATKIIPHSHQDSAFLR